MLAATLAEEVEPMVKEVFDEHRLPPDFSRRVLENVPRVGYTPRDGVVESAVIVRQIDQRLSG